MSYCLLNSSTYVSARYHKQNMSETELLILPLKSALTSHLSCCQFSLLVALMTLELLMTPGFLSNPTFVPSRNYADCVHTPTHTLAVEVIEECLEDGWILQLILLPSHHHHHCLLPRLLRSPPYWYCYFFLALL